MASKAHLSCEIDFKIFDNPKNHHRPQRPAMVKMHMIWYGKNDPCSLAHEMASKALFSGKIGFKSPKNPKNHLRGLLLRKIKGR